MATYPDYDVLAERADLPITDRTFAGFRLTTIVLAAVIALLIAWNIWSTRELLALRKQKIVSVSLATLITDYVAEQSKAGGSPEEVSAKAKLYLAATESALRNLGKDGTPVLASEAVIGNSVPDYTPAVKEAVAKALNSPAVPASAADAAH